ncbi:hypothetical protein JCM10207_002336 [Rhodosporidiobolus poonsookiae]
MLFSRNKQRAPKEPPVYASWQNNTAANWWQDASLRKNVFWAFVLYFGPFVQGYDGAYFNALQIMPPFNDYFDTPTGTRLGLFSASAYLPLVVLAPFQGQICDWLGRRLCTAVGSAGVIAGAFVGAFATSEAEFIGARVLVGAANGLVLIATNLALNELLHPRLRSVSAAIYFCGYYIGSSTASWFGFIAVKYDWTDSSSWRVCTGLQAFGAIILLIAAVFMPESPRWLMARGKKEQAHKILADLHSNGKLDDELVLNEVEEIEASLTREKEERAGWTSFFATPGNRKRLAVLFLIGSGSQLNGVGLPSYFLSSILNLVGVTDAVIQAGINGGLALWNLVCSCLGASMVESVGRRPLWIWATFGMLVSFILLTGLSGGFDATQNTATGYASVGCIFFVYLFYDICWTPLPYSYTLEILPFSLRAKGISLFIWAQQVSLCFNCFVNPIALDAIGWYYYFVYIGTLTFYLTAAILLFKETKGLSLEQVALLYDRPDADRADKKAAILSELRDPSLPAGTKFSGGAAEIRHLEDEEVTVGGDNDSVAPKKHSVGKKG